MHSNQQHGRWCWRQKKEQRAVHMKTMREEGGAQKRDRAARERENENSTKFSLIEGGRGGETHTSDLVSPFPPPTHRSGRHPHTGSAKTKTDGGEASTQHKKKGDKI